MKAVIFDMDGVIIDSEPLWDQSDSSFIEKHGLDVSHDPAIKGILAGKGMPESAAILKEMYGITDTVEEMNRVRTDVLMSLYDAHLVLEKGFIELAERLKNAGVRMALASGSPYALIDYVIDRFAIRKFFHTIISSDDLPKGKPEPDIFLETARRLGVHATDCLVVEDSVNGLESAKRAGMKCVAYFRPYSDGSMGSADFKIRNFREFDIRWLNGGAVK